MRKFKIHIQKVMDIHLHIVYQNSSQKAFKINLSNLRGFLANKSTLGFVIHIGLSGTPVYCARGLMVSLPVKFNAGCTLG